MIKIIKYLDRVIYWLIVAVPFSIAISPGMANSFIGIMIFSYMAKKILKREKIIPRTAVNMPVLFFFIISLLSITHSINLKDSLVGGMLRLLLFSSLMFIIAAELKDERQLRRVAYSIAASLMLVTFDGLWQIRAGRDFIAGREPVLNLGLMRATASFKDSNLLGIYLSGFTPLLLGLALYGESIRRKVFFYLSAAIALAGILLTYSRPSFLAIYIVLIFFAIARRHKALLIFLVILTLLFPFFVPQSVKNWAKDVEYNPLRMMCNDDRIAVYRNSLNMIKAHPLIGLGTNNYMKSYKYYKERPEYRNIVTLEYMRAHNMYLEMAAELGLTGLGIFFWMLFRLFAAARAAYKRLEGNYLKIIALSLGACLLAFLINGLTESSFYYSRVAPVFWYISGLILGLGRSSLENSHDKNSSNKD
ncbi:MAG: O-antigen ligase family protein [Candidatus Omnitrophota bacterium]|nr:O-antigen ligase family protein [Candidatus Omnitrophota bacterium]